MKRVFFLLLFAFLASNVLALSVSVASETHTPFKHEIVFNVLNDGATDEIKTWDLNLLNLNSDISDVKYFVFDDFTQTTKQITEFTKNACPTENITTKLIDTNQQRACYEKPDFKNLLYVCQNKDECYLTTSAQVSKTFVPNDWVQFRSVTEAKTTDKTVLTLPAFKFDKAKTTKIKVTFKTKFDSSTWQSKGSWAMNPSNWWNASYVERYPLNLSGTYSEIKANDTLIVRDINTATWACSADNNKVAVVWQNGATSTELSADIPVGTCGGLIDIAFKSRFAIPASATFNTSDTNGYYFYVSASAVASPDRNYLNVYKGFDGFEDGDYTGATSTQGAVWTVTAGSFSVQTTTKKAGAYAVSGANEIYMKPNSQPADVNINVVSSWVYLTQEAGAGGRTGDVWAFMDDSALWANNYSGIARQSGVWTARNRINGGSHNYPEMSPNSFSINTWYKFVLYYNWATSDFNAYIYSDEQEKNLVSSLLNVDFGAYGHQIYRIYFETDATAYWDNLTYYYAPLIKPTYAVGAKQVSANDANITFNVFRAGTSTNLTGITADWNVNAYDVSGQNSPFTQDVNIGTYLVTFSKTGYDLNTNFLVTADQNKTYTIYLADSNAPTTTLSGCTSGWNKTNQTITLSCFDNGSGCASTAYKLDLLSWNAYSDPFVLSTDGNHRIDYNSTDTAGNIESTKTSYCAVDKTAPTTSISGCGAGWNNSDQTITLTCADTNSGCATTQYRLDGGAWQTYSGTFNLTTDLNHQIDFNSIDVATNIETTKTSWCAVDKTAPTVGATTFVGFTIFGNFINGVGNIIGGIVNATISGIDTSLCQYTINGGGTWLSAVWNTDHCEKIGVTISNGVVYDANTSATDNAGNTGYGTGTGQYIGDTNAPLTTDNSNNAWSATNETVTLTCNDFTGSGCKQTFYCIDGTGACTPTTIGNSASVTCSAGSVCTQYVRYLSQDNVDNNETAHNSLLTRIDKENPTATSIAITDTNGRTEDQQPDLTISATDGSGSGLKEMAFSCNGSTWGSWIAYNTSYSSFDLRTGAGCTTAYGNKTVYLKVRDNLDQESSSTNDSTILDATVTYGDLNLFGYGNYSKNIDLNSNTDENIVFQFKATSNDLNVSSAKVYMTSSVDDVNCEGWVRTTQICGWQTETYFFQQALAGTTYTIRSQSDDDHVYKDYTYNLSPEAMKTKSATKFTLNDPNNWAQVVLTNGLFDKNIFTNFSFNANGANAGIKNLEVYDCNSSQTSFPNTNCGQKTFSSLTPKDLDGYYSMKNISDDQNKLNGVALNKDGNHFYYLNCPTCNVANYWELILVDANSNIDRVRNQTSTTGVASLAPNVRTIDAHAHFLNLSKNNAFNFYFTIANNQGKTYTSSIYTETINQANLPPRFVDLFSPLNQIYKGTIDVNVTVFDPDGSAIVCDFNLYTIGLQNKGVLAESISPVNEYCTTTINSTDYTDGNYLVFMTVRETATTNLFSRSEYGRNFMIANSAPTYTAIDGNGLHAVPFNVSVVGLDYNVSGKKSAQYRINAGAWTNFLTDYNVPITVDGNYRIDFNFTNNAGNSLLITGVDANTIPPTPPEITISENNSGKSFIKTFETIPVIFTLKDADSTVLFLDLYYSDTNVIGSGTAIFLNESTSGANLLCDDANFQDDTNCSYAWNFDGIADGNYYFSAIVSDGALDANDVTNATFEIVSPPPIPVSTAYTERYIAPTSKQRDTNVFYNPTSLFALSEPEKQTEALQAMQTNIFWVGIIIIGILAVLTVFLWKRK